MRSKLAPLLAGLAAVFIWAAIPALVKTGCTEQNLAFLLMMRFLIASLLFSPVIFNVLKKLTLVSKIDLVLLMLILGTNYYFQGLAMIRLPSSWYLVMFSLNPILALLTLRLKLRYQQIFGIGIACIGSVLFVNTAELSQQFPVSSYIFLTLGMLTWVLYTWKIQAIQKVMNDIESTALTQILSLVAATAIWVYSERSMVSIKFTEMIPLLILGIFTPAAYLGFNYCLRRNAKFGIASQYLEPVFGIAIGFVLFHETLTVLQLVGSGAILWGSSKLVE
jgi:drug/metabolite transporter (DMT)-like permease